MAIKQDETICFKVNRSIADLTLAMGTGRLDIQTMAERLHAIRRDAQTMEEALKLRKKMMIKAGIEEKYQKEKEGPDYKPADTNKIVRESDEFTNKPKSYHFVIKDLDKNEIVYDQDVHGVVMAAVEEIKDVDPMGTIEGQAQHLLVGHPLVLWYGFDQINQSMEARKTQIMLAMAEEVKKGGFADPKIKELILRAANRSIGK